MISGSRPSLKDHSGDSQSSRIHAITHTTGTDQRAAPYAALHTFCSSTSEFLLFDSQSLKLSMHLSIHSCLLSWKNWTRLQMPVPTLTMKCSRSMKRNMRTSPRRRKTQPVSLGGD